MKVKLILAAGLALAAAAQPPVLYSPGPPVPFALSTANLSYRDAAGDQRTLSLTLRAPAGNSLPVVLWSHSQDVRAATLQRWSEATAAAGYLTITIDHPTRDIPQVLRLCEALKVTTDEQCREVGQVNWDRPHDLRQVLDWLERNAPNADLQRIALAGHADGASAALSLAGAKRLLSSANRRTADDFTDPRPLAFVALSPHGPMRQGFYDVDWRDPVSGYVGVKRPVLLVTGVGDNNCDDQGTCITGDSPARRRAVFHVLPPGGKILMHFGSAQLAHEQFGTLDPALCTLSRAECDAFDRWMRSTVLAFLDTHVRRSTAAEIWLAENARRIAAASNITWETK